MKIEDSIAVITGASSGVGQAVALQLARRNIHGLALVDHQPPPLQLAALMDQHRGDSMYFDFHGNLADEDFRRRVYEEMGVRCGTVNICISLPTGLRTSGIWEGIETGLMDAVSWAREMVLGAAAARGRKNYSRWRFPEAARGVVILVIPKIASRHERENLGSGLKSRLKKAISSLAVDAEFNGVICEVLSLNNHPFLHLRIKGTGDRRHFSSIRIQPDAPPQALSEVICSIIESDTNVCSTEVLQ